MEKLTRNEEKVWTVLRDFPTGLTVCDLQSLIKQRKKNSISRSSLYEALNGLRDKGYVDHKKPKWYPIENTSNKNRKEESLYRSILKEELDRIRNDYVNRNLVRAHRRIRVLNETVIPHLKLPEEKVRRWKELTIEYDKWLKRVIFDELKLKVAEKMIPKFLALFEEMLVEA